MGGGRGSNRRSRGRPRTRHVVLTLNDQSESFSTEQDAASNENQRDQVAHNINAVNVQSQPPTANLGEQGGRPAGRMNHSTPFLTLETQKRRKRSRVKRPDPPPDHPSDSDSDSDSVSEGAAAMSDDDSVDSSDSDDDEEAQFAFWETVHSWNSEQGYPELMKHVQAFFDELHNHGCVCCICGERRFSGGVISLELIRSWHFGRKTVEELRAMFYPQYPKERTVQTVSFVCYIHLIIRTD